MTTKIKDDLTKQFRAFLIENNDCTICQSIVRMCESEYFTFDELGEFSMDDVYSLYRQAESQIKVGEDCEAIMLALANIEEARSQFEKGVISMPSFVTRVKDWMSLTAEGQE